LVTIFAGGFLPPLLLSVFIIEGAVREDAAEIVVFSSLAMAASAGAIWVAKTARAAIIDSCPRLAAMLGASRPIVRSFDAHIVPTAPLAVLIAGKLPPIPWLLRPVLGLWWTAHFAGAAALGTLAYDCLLEILKGAPFQQRVFLPLGIYVPLLYAANLYLLLAAAVFFRNPTVHTRLWRWRLVVDLAFALIALQLGMRR
jgi:hypothetical protein